MKKCLNCGYEFKERAVGTINEKRFCCFQCRTRYNSRRQVNSNNKEMFRKASNKNYINNKGKCNSRIITLKVVKEGKCKMIMRCNKCNNKNNLEIHHSIYPIEQKEIIKAINEGKIYYLCKICHGKIGRDKIDRDKKEVCKTKPIKVDSEVKSILDKNKKHERETYNYVLRRTLKLN